MGVEILECPHKNWIECCLNPGKLDLVRRYQHVCACAILPTCIAAIVNTSDIVALSFYSEEDLERLLALYAKHSKSSSVLLSCSDHSQPPESLTANAASTTDVTNTGRHCTVSKDTSRILHRESQLPRQLPFSSRRGQRKSSQHPLKASWTSGSSTHISATPPPPFILTNFSRESCSLPPHQKKSLDTWTRSLEAGRGPSVPVPHGLPPKGPRRGAQGQTWRRGGGQKGGGRAGGQLRRSCSVQSLFSLSSDASGKKFMFQVINTVCSLIFFFFFSRAITGIKCIWRTVLSIK